MIVLSVVKVPVVLSVNYTYNRVSIQNVISSPEVSGIDDFNSVAVSSESVNVPSVRSLSHFSRYKPRLIKIDI